MPDDLFLFVLQVKMCNGTAVPFFDVTIPDELNAGVVICIGYSFLPYLFVLVSF